MYKTTKKWSITVLSVILAIACVLMCACGDKKTPELNIEQSKLTMIVFDDYLLKYELKNSDQQIQWNSSDNTIVTVSDGKLTAKKEGTATITGSVDGASDTCEVTVVKTDYIPTLFVSEEQEIGLMLNGTYTFEPKVFYKNEPSEAVFSYSSNNPTVAEITSDGTVTAKAYGQAIISVNANFKGYDVMKTVMVTVAPALGGEVSLNGEAITSEFSVPATDVVTLTVKTYMDGEADNSIQVSWSKVDDNSLATITQNGKEVQITANKPGNVTLKATYTKGEYTSDNEYTLKIVKKVVKQDNEVFVSKKSAVEGETSITLPTTIDVTKITNVTVANVTKDVISYDNSTGKNSVKISTDGLPVGQITVGFETELYSYSFDNAVIADVVINSITTLEYMGNDMLAKETDGKYYVLEKDVSFGGFQWPASWPTAQGKAAYFGGTFDGYGHKIYNMQMRYGLFNTISVAGTVRNLIVDIDNKGATDNGAIANVCHGTIENCMVITKITAGENVPSVKFAGLATRVSSSGVVKNCIVNITDYTPYSNHEIVRLNAIAYTTDQGATIANCYAVSAYSDYMYGTVTAGLYASKTAFLSAVTTLPIADGWSNYWSINNGLYYNGVKVM